jgi:hypothetical protein
VGFVQRTFKIAGKWRGNTLPESIGKILVFKKIILGLWRNEQKKLDAHGGFTPTASAPPNTITPEKVIHRHRSKRRERLGRQALPPPSMYILSFIEKTWFFYRAHISWLKKQNCPDSDDEDNANKCIKEVFCQRWFFL